MKLDHIALYVTDLNRSINFYKTVLHAKVFGPVSPSTLSFGGRFAEKITTGERKKTRSLISHLSHDLERNTRINIALVSSNGVNYDILLVEQRDKEKPYIKSVEGKTVYGFSFTLSPEVDMEILSWDLNTLGVTFQHGNSGMDGTIYTTDNPDHSIYIKDPDERVIELKSGDIVKPDMPFIQSLDSITLHVTYPDKSLGFYKDKLQLKSQILKSDSKDKTFNWLFNDDGERLILLYGIMQPDGTPVKAGGYGLDHFSLKGLSTNGITPGDVTDILMDPEKLDKKTYSQYLCDDLGYWIEIQK